MGLSEVGIAPQFVITANGADISDKINSRLISLRYSDSAGFDSDSLEFTISDGIESSPVEMPNTGAEIELSLGYDLRVVKMGRFIVDEVTREGWPETISVRARSASFDKGKNGEKQLQTQRNKKHEKGTFGKLVENIAKTNGLQSKVSDSLSSIDLGAQHQIDESDLHFLIRIARRFDGIIKVADGKLMAVKKSENKTMSGGSLSISVSVNEVTSYRLTLAKREESGSVRAYWHEHKKAKRHAVTVGEGDPETSLKGLYTDKTAAESAAKSELARRGRQKEKLELTLPGRPEFAAEAELTVSGFRSGVNGKWNITSVEHEISASSGYRVSIEAERTNAGAFSNGSSGTDKIEGEDDEADQATDDGSSSQ